MKSFFYKTLYPFITIFGVAIIILYRFDIMYPIIDFIVNSIKFIICYSFCYVYPIYSLCAIDALMKNDDLSKTIKLSNFKENILIILFSLYNPFLLYLSVYYCIDFLINFNFVSNVKTILVCTAILFWALFITGGLLQVFFGVFNNLDKEEKPEDAENNS